MWSVARKAHAAHLELRVPLLLRTKSAQVLPQQQPARNDSGTRKGPDLGSYLENISTWVCLLFGVPLLGLV